MNREHFRGDRLLFNTDVDMTMNFIENNKSNLADPD